MKRATAVLLALALLAGLTPGLAEGLGILGKPFPDFSVETADGEIFTLSQVLKEKQAVVINLWASWCGPCMNEFPFLNEAYEARKDQVAVIALSTEKADTLQAIRQTKDGLGLTLPMGRDESGLSAYVAVSAIPTTVVVDRFGNAVFRHTGMMTNAGQFIRLMDAFLGEDYTETKVLMSLPRAVNFQITAEDQPVRKIRFLYNGADVGWLGLILEGNTVSLRMEADAPADAYMFIDEEKQASLPVNELYDKKAGAYLYQAEILEGNTVGIVGLVDTSQEDGTLVIWLCAGEQAADSIAAQYRQRGQNITWEYIDE